MFWLITLLSCSKAPTVYTPAPSFYPVDAEMTMSPDVTMGTLDNGLTYYILPHPKPAERVELRLALKAGSLHEADDQLGLAHFLEHMAFNGTESFPKNSLIDYMESIGMSFGAHINALTSFDRTIYKLRVPTDTEGALEQALLILKEQAGNQLLLDEDINAERGVVLEEWRSSQGSMSRIQDDLLSSLLGEQYAKRLPIGTKESLETFDPVKTKREFRKRLERTRDERIYELWKTDIRNVNIEDIARKIDTESSMARMGSVGASLDAAAATRSFASGDFAKHARGVSEIPGQLN